MAKKFPKRTTDGTPPNRKAMPLTPRGSKYGSIAMPPNKKK